MTRKKDLDFYTNNITTPLNRTVKKYEKIKIAPNVAKPIKPISDADGLDIAYRQGNGLYHYGNTLYIAGTKSLGDALDDLKIPFHATKYIKRYKDAERHVANPTNDISHVVGHSMGSSVALELEKNYPNLKSTVYATPTISTPFEKQNARYRNPADPISILDRGANVSNEVSLNPFKNHSYNTFKNVSGGGGGWLIGDTSKDTPWDPKTSTFTTPPIEQENLN